MLFLEDEQPVATKTRAIRINDVIFIIFCIIIYKITKISLQKLVLINTISNINIVKKRVLVVPLDWGLGHATRCIPVINEFLTQEFEVLIAAEREIAALLAKEFPLIKILPLQGYRILYSKNKTLFFIKMFSQFPKILAAIKNEKKWLNDAIKKNNIDIVVADNRYGLHNKNCYCIFITHQLFIKTGNRFTEWLAQKINYKYINNFNECWVPDVEGKNNLAGKLSHSFTKLLIPVKYIGILSRFVNTPTIKSIDLLILLSGPEPQRTIFENKLLEQLKTTTLKTVFVRGLPLAKNKIIYENERVEIKNHLPAIDLNKLILSAKTVVARSGYSTIMDIAQLQTAAILIPTPGQTEQEYLAKYLAEKNYCISTVQKNFNLQINLKKISTTTLKKFPESIKGILQKEVNALK